MSIQKKVANSLAQEIIALGSSTQQTELTEDILEKMLIDIDISSALELMDESIVSRDWTIATDIIELEDKAQEVQTRFNNINMSKILKDMLKAVRYKRSIFNISYENMIISDLVLIPNKYITYDSASGWKIKTDKQEILISENEKDFLVCVNNQSLDNMEGSSGLAPLVKTFLTKESIDSKLNSIIEKYGDIITVFAYEAPLENATEEEKKARYSDVEEQAKQLKQAKGKDILAVPTNGNKSLNDFVNFIKLDDLKPEIYLTIKQEYEKAIQKFILGSTLVSDNNGPTGSRALGEVHNQQKDYKLESKIKSIRDWMQKLIELDAVLYGYNAKEFYFKFVEELDEKEELNIEKQKAEVLSQKMDAIGKLYQVGYTLTNSKMAEYLGFDFEDLKEVSQSGVASEKVFSELKKEIQVKEFMKKTTENRIISRMKKKEVQQNKYLESIDKYFYKYKNEVVKAVKTALSKINSVEDIPNMSYEYSNILEEMLLKGKLIGYDHENMLTGTNFAEDLEPNDVMTKKINPAVDYFSKKYPALYEDIVDHKEYARDKNFWIKKSTDINITESIMNDLKKNIETGQTFEDWKKDIKTNTDKLGISQDEGYLKMVYRTNMQQAYNAGAYERQLKYADDWPYLKYSGTLDGREQIHTRKLNGKVFKVGSPEATMYYPPNGYNCRCYMLSLTQEEFEQGKYELVEKEIDELDLKDFNGNVGDKEYMKKIEKSYQIKAKDFNEAKDNLKFVENKSFENQDYKTALEIDDIYDIIDVERITNEQSKAFKRYSLDSYVDINDTYRGKMQGTQETLDLMKHLEKGITSKTKENIQVFRGVSGKWANDLKLMGDELIKEEIKEYSLLSTSLSYSISKKFAGEIGVIFNIKVPKGTNCYYMSSEDAIISEELELVFSPKSKILVTNVYKKDNLMIIEGEYRDASM